MSPAELREAGSSVSNVNALPSSVEPFLLLCRVAFALLFYAIRVVGFLRHSFDFWRGLLFQRWHDKATKVHVALVFLVSNALLVALQLYWAALIAKAAADLVAD